MPPPSESLRPGPPELKLRDAAAATSRCVAVSRWHAGQIESVSDEVAEEVPVAITFHGVPYVVMLTTPADLEDLGYGFTLTESLVASPDEIREVKVVEGSDSCELQITIAAERFGALLQRRRNLAGRSGCGLCGTETLEQAMRAPAAVGAGIAVANADLHASLAALHEQQLINARTGSVHAAAWCLPGSGVRLTREDVGRHNALDKVVGALLRAQRDAATGYLLISSRASYEMVLKAAIAGVSVLAAISAPTALAIRLAEHCGMTLVGFARDNSHVVYTHPQRLN
jgi:FdhD protein